MAKYNVTIELAAVLVVALTSIWLYQVQSTVPDPYLDELFHVRQAQEYCNGNFYVWDPKITTPPGLYLLSVLAQPLIGCSILSLRIIAAATLVGLVFIVHAIYSAEDELDSSSGDRSDVGGFAWHNALNVALFPPLFFFSCLYYTDVPSTLSVLLFWYLFQKSQKESWPPRISQSFLLTLAGVTSLLFRQTNIFWVAVFPAGITLIREVDRGHTVIKQSMYKGSEGFGDSLMSVAKTSWKHQVVFAPPVRDASIGFFTKTVVSTGASTLSVIRKPKGFFTLLARQGPYLTTLAIFAAFIVVNGGVVLGDKSNHVASIHVPQMLYIWPYIAFFSWPLLAPYLLILPLVFLAGNSPMEPMLVFRRRHFVPRRLLLAAVALAACLAIRYNTIVHPFTLADNRHYTFYIFRLLLNTNPWVRYAVTPLYMLTAWAAIQTLGARNRTSAPGPTTNPSSNKKDNKSTEDPEDSDSSTPPLPPAHSNAASVLPTSSTPTTTLFLLLWLLTTTLQLVTAPLFEPRYLLLPWIFWRMHLPTQQPFPSASRLAGGSDGGSAKGSKKTSTGTWGERQNPLLWAETAWFLIVNAVTGYIFLRRGFEWPSEPGKVQRFMW